MPESLSALETRRADLLHSIAMLHDLRPGSIVGAAYFAARKTNVPLRPTTRATDRTCGSPINGTASP